MSSKFKEGKKAALKSDNPSEAGKKKKFEFPSNIRQIGSINRGLKIYIEDYAHTYINSLCAKKDNGETAAFLVGFLAKELGEDVLVISGAISPPFMTPSSDGQVFSESDWQYAKKIIEKYFSGLDIVGWARLQPGYGLYLSASDINSHYLGFTDKHAVLFLCDPEEKLDCFFSWNENQDDLSEASGYFIYYDKNHEMNAYIAEMRKAGKQRLETDFVNIVEDVEAVEILREEEARDDDGALSRSVGNAKRIAEIQRQKRIIGMMSSVSLLLFFACVIMGIGLLQSGERISVVESQLRELRTGYNNIVTRLNDSVFPAFAAQTEKQPEAEIVADTAPPPDPAPEITDSYTQEDNISLDKELGIAVAEVPAETPSEVPAGTPSEISAGTSAEAAAPEPTIYIVQQGDTLSQISGKFYGTINNVAAIMEANDIANPDKLTVGAKLIIP